jgi:hypothetical protein
MDEARFPSDRRPVQVHNTGLALKALLAKHVPLEVGTPIVLPMAVAHPLYCPLQWHTSYTAHCSGTPLTLCPLQGHKMHPLVHVHTTSHFLGLGLRV